MTYCNITYNILSYGWPYTFCVGAVDGGFSFSQEATVGVVIDTRYTCTKIYTYTST